MRKQQILPDSDFSLLFEVSLISSAFSNVAEYSETLITVLSSAVITTGGGGGIEDKLITAPFTAAFIIVSKCYIKYKIKYKNIVSNKNKIK